MDNHGTSSEWCCMLLCFWHLLCLRHLLGHSGPGREPNHTDQTQRHGFTIPTQPDSLDSPESLSLARPECCPCLGSSFSKNIGADISVQYNGARDPSDSSLRDGHADTPLELLECAEGCGVLLRSRNWVAKVTGRQ